MDQMAQIVSESAGALFSEDWWFDAVCPGAWDRHEVRRDGRLFASLAFHFYKKMGFRYVAMPNLTRTLDPLIRPGASKPVGRLQSCTAILKELLDGMPEHDRLEICLSPSCDLALPFSLLGYRNSATYTFQHQGESQDMIWTGMDQKTRNMIVSARRRLDLHHHYDIERYIRLSRGSRKSCGTDKSDYAAITRAFEACLRRNQALILSAVDEEARDVASAILIWDRHQLYYWMSARDACRSGNAANSFLVWESLVFAMSIGRRFDMDGFITPQNGVFLARFGLHPVARHYVTNVNPMWSMFSDIKGILAPTSGEISYR